jgi:hypothetical protein
MLAPLFVMDGVYFPISEGFFLAVVAIAHKIPRKETHDFSRGRNCVSQFFTPLALNTFSVKIGI